jgi:hypothetical protein
VTSSEADTEEFEESDNDFSADDGENDDEGYEFRGLYEGAEGDDGNDGIDDGKVGAVEGGSDEGIDGNDGNDDGKVVEVEGGSVDGKVAAVDDGNDDDDDDDYIAPDATPAPGEGGDLPARRTRSSSKNQ